MHSKLNLKSLGLAVLILVMALFSGSSAIAAITANGSFTSAEAANANSLTWSHTVEAGTNRVLFVELAMSNNNSLVTGVAYGGVALTQVGRGEGNHAVEIWLLIDPAVGTANVVASFTAATAAVGGATTFNGVSQSTPTGSFVSASGTGTTGSVTVPSATGDLVIDVQYWHGDISGGPDAGQTINWFEQNATHLGASTRKDGASSVVMSASVTTGSTEWEYGAVSIKASTFTVYGNVFEDVNYGGGAGRTWATASGNGGSARPAARVELFDAAGAFVTSTTTDGSGNYSFANVAAGNYTVRSVSSSVTSVRTGYVAALRPVQTYRTNASTGTAVDVTDYVGGHDPATADAGNAAAGWVLNSSTGVFSGSGAGKAHAFAPVTVGAADVTGVDFGWNFNTIVNTNDSGQGSLRQFIINANALGNAALAIQGQPAGRDVSVFMISDGLAHPGLQAGLANQLSAGVAVITSATDLPAITDANTTIDGTTQTANVGNTNAVVLGTGGTVGVDGLALSTVPGPEVEIAGSATLANGLQIQANNAIVRGLSIHGFGDASPEAGVRVDAVTNALIEGNVLGSRATSFTDPGAAQRNQAGVASVGGISGIVRNNLIGFSRATGVNLTSGSTGWVITGNEIRDNGMDTADGDGITENASSSNTASGNLITGTSSQGIAVTMAGATGNQFINNTVAGNGVGTASSLVQSPGIVLRSGAASTTLDRNVIRANYGAGVQANNGSTGTRITRNSFALNGTIIARNGSGATGQIAIDLNSASDDIEFGTTPFYTMNDANDADAGANGLLNFPVLVSASAIGGNLVLTGYARPGSLIELYIANPDPSGFGEGETYLLTLTEGGTGAGGTDPYADTDAGAGAYGPGAQGTDNTNQFTFTFPIPGGVSTGMRLTATATLGGETSEFSGLVTVAGVSLAIIKQVWEPNGSAPLGSPVSAPAGAPLVFLIYVKNTTTIPVTDIRINDLLDQTGFDYVSGSLVRTLAASPPADTATNKQIFDATDPGTGTALSDNLDGDVGSALDTGAPAGVDRITIGAVTGQANGSLTINAHTTFALRFNVKIK